MQAQADETGVYIQPSRRPDGSLRKAIRVKAGYVPQDEVPLYESKGKQFSNRRSAQNIPIGLDPSHVTPKTVDPRNPIPGLVVLNHEEKDKKKKKKQPSDKSSTATATTSLISNKSQKGSNSKIKETTKSSSKSGGGQQKQNIENLSPEECEKRIKNLKKKVREIKTLEQKIENGEIKNIEKDQKEKISRKTDLLSEIMALKLSLYGDSPEGQSLED